MDSKLVFMAILGLSLLMSSCNLKNSDTQTPNWEGAYSFGESMPSMENKQDTWRWQYVLKVNSAPESSQSYTVELDINGHKTELSLDCIGMANADSLQIIFQDYPPDAEQIQYNKGDLLLTLYKKDGKVLTYWRGLQPNVEENLVQGKAYFNHQ
ncbi:hypothetical protein SAMN05421780_111141 [Flexibacter flexilis DSM 6793]|uniref:Lipoprotein n=2 Tax=Flexibacter flexilis TaxID=998 RepID=A0A1I1MW27_9BACT|nr:hypothetical protein SAMN05421780_111141 [Flexibacter flexilis DSM 6793]